MRTTFSVSAFPKDGDTIRAEPGGKYTDLLLTLGDLKVHLSRESAYRILSALENELSRRRETDLDENRERLAYEHKHDEAAGDGPRQEPPWMDPDLAWEQDLEDQMREDEIQRKLESA